MIAQQGGPDSEQKTSNLSGTLNFCAFIHHSASAGFVTQRPWECTALLKVLFNVWGPFCSLYSQSCCKQNFFQGKLSVSPKAENLRVKSGLSPHSALSDLSYSYIHTQFCQAFFTFPLHCIGLHGMCRSAETSFCISMCLYFSWSWVCLCSI